MDETEKVLKQIRECDRMYIKAYGLPDEAPDSNVCKKMLAMGFDIGFKNLAEFCIRYCARWELNASNGRVC
ncbi:MAG: hypothetical protein V1744_00325 [Candidatus Altiarchaeota archaeon]